jgi:hypothetical protein
MTGLHNFVIIVFFSLSVSLNFAFETPNVAIEENIEDAPELGDYEQVYEVNELGAVFDPITGQRRYDDYQLIRAEPKSDEHLDVLKFLQKGNWDLFWDIIGG